MKFWFLKISLLYLVLSMFGCLGHTNETIYKKNQEHDQYVNKLQQKAESIPPETLRKTKVTAVIPKPLPEVYKSAIPLLTNLEGMSSVSPLPAALADGTKVFRIIYLDIEPIYYNKKPIEFDEALGTQNLGIYVTVLLESQGADTTAVYFCPHNRLCSRIPNNLKKVVEENMTYRGKLFITRLHTQFESDSKWSWISR